MTREALASTPREVEVTLGDTLLVRVDKTVVRLPMTHVMDLVIEDSKEDEQARGSVPGTLG